MLQYASNSNTSFALSMSAFSYIHKNSLVMCLHAIDMDHHESWDPPLPRLGLLSGVLSKGEMRKIESLS